MTAATYKPKVYTASTLHYHKFWQTLAVDPDWNFVRWTATWPSEPLVATALEAPDTITEDQNRYAWVMNINQVKYSDFLVLYAKPSDRLRGALIEAGVALGIGIPVLAVGVPDDHTWMGHPAVKKFNSMVEVRYHLLRYTTMIPPAKTKRKESEDE